MDFTEINSLPQILFSHAFEADEYTNRFSPKKNFLEVSYIEKGEFTVKSGNREYVLRQGDVCCLFKMADTVVTATKFHRHCTVAATLEWSSSADGSAGLMLPPVTPAEYCLPEVYKIIDDFIYVQAKYMSSKVRGAAKFLNLLCEIDRCNRKHSESYVSGNRLYTQKAKKYINDNLHKNLTQNEIAKHLGISAGYLCDVFKKSENTTVMNYINKLKLDGIKYLMENVNMPLYEAAEVYGYKDPNYVSRLYKKMYGHNITEQPNFYNIKEL